jgi:copper chaperone CopZ
MIEKYNVSGMTCAGCANVVNKLLSKVESVKNVTVDLSEKEVAIETDEPLRLEELSKALKSSPYQISAGV